MAATVDRQPAPPDAAAEKPLASHGRRTGIALAVLSVLTGLAGLLLAGRFLLNLHFMREYDAGRYDAAGPQALTYVNFAEPWVAYHNLGCATYMLGSYELAEGAFVQALDTKPPHEGEYPACECDIRLNLALSIVRPLDLGWKTEQERQSLIAALSRARGHLTDAGCANPEKGVYDGHFDKAEQLKKEIDEALERLEDPSSRDDSDDDQQQQQEGQEGQQSQGDGGSQRSCEGARRGAAGITARAREGAAAETEAGARAGTGRRKLGQGQRRPYGGIGLGNDQHPWAVIRGRAVGVRA